MSAGGAWTYFTTDLVDQSVRAYLLFESAGCFQRVVRDQGQDITNLLVSSHLTLRCPQCAHRHSRLQPGSITHRHSDSHWKSWGGRVCLGSSRHADTCLTA